jgi:hypothetical protein
MPPKATAIRFAVFSQEEIRMLSLSTVQKVLISIKPVDKKGNPAKVDGIPVWDVSVKGIVALFPAPDGMECDVIGVSPGGVQVNVQADANLDAGIKTITGTLDVQVTPAEAVGFAIQTEAVVDQ